MHMNRRTLSDDLYDRRLGTMFLGTLVAIPVAGLIGLPLLLLLLLLFGLNPLGLGQRLGQYLQALPGFRSGCRVHMVVACLVYLLPISLLGIAVLAVDGIILGVIP
jgi:hypothetical protein